MSGSSAQVALGTLNRALTHITFASYPALNITAQNMGPSFAHAAPEGDFVTQPEVAVGAVPSLEPFVMVSVSVGIVRTQSLAAAWLAQIQATGVLGTMVIYPDVAGFPSLSMSDTVIKSFDPGAYDGKDPVISLVLRGVFFPNANMWA